MFSKIFTVILGIASVANALPHVDNAATTRGLEAREASWEEYDQNTESLVQQGLCRFYLDTSIRDNLVMCQRFCQNNSVMCKADTTYLTDPSVKFINPDNEHYVMGECDCNVGIPNAIATFVAEGLGQSDGIICEVWLESFVSAADILSTLVLPAGITFKAFKAIWNIVNKANTASSVVGFNGINELITKTCGSDILTQKGIKKELLESGYNTIKQIDINKIAQ